MRMDLQRAGAWAPLRTLCGHFTACGAGTRSNAPSPTTAQARGSWRSTRATLTPPRLAPETHSGCLRSRPNVGNICSLTRSKLRRPGSRNCSTSSSRGRPRSLTTTLTRLRSASIVQCSDDEEAGHRLDLSCKPRGHWTRSPQDPEYSGHWELNEPKPHVAEEGPG